MVYSESMRVFLCSESEFPDTKENEHRTDYFRKIVFMKCIHFFFSRMILYSEDFYSNVDIAFVLYI